MVHFRVDFSENNNVIFGVDKWSTRFWKSNIRVCAKHRIKTSSEPCWKVDSIDQTAYVCDRVSWIGLFLTL